VRVAAIALAALVAFGASGCLAVGAAAATAGRETPTPSRAPKGPPLTDGAGSAEAQGAEEAAAEAPQAEADPLVSNGLGSPSCGTALASQLSQTGRRNCETSGFVAAPAPTDDYGLDVHIDTGVLSPNSWVPSITQDMLVTPLWMALVWAVHALVVMLEWSFTIELLDGPATARVGGGLRQMQAAFTEPWLPLALAATSMTALYHGIVRRRVADTLGEVLLTIAMMVGGIGIILDPTGTVGALGRWADQASLGTLAVAARGSPDEPRQALAGGLGTLFATVVETPWCYLEFGDVGWCRESSRLDPRLRAAALKIAAQERAEGSCGPGAAQVEGCAPVGAEQAQLLEHSAELLRGAQSNGAIFLALPANGAARNSINQEGSLLRTLCQSSEADGCRGPTAAQAEFRTSGETWFRLGGLLLIAGGLLGMLLLIGFVTLRLLRAAVFGVLYLLLAPALVLAPAFGETGRALFRRWLAHLFGAVVSKLLFSFLLGVVLAVLAILSQLTTLGWWTQWLLMSTFWWGAFLRRHQAFGLAAGALTNGGPALEHGRRRSLVRRIGEALETPRKGIAIARMVRERRSGSEPDARRRAEAQVGGELARERLDEQTLRTLESGHREARGHAEAAPETQSQLADRRRRLGRLSRARADAVGRGDTRRAAELAHREDRVRGEISQEQGALSASQRAVREGERSQRRTGEVHTREQRDAQSGFLDAQMTLSPAAQRRPGERRRDYGALAGLVGYGREEYERLGARPQRAVRLEIDRELALRRELSETAHAPVPEIDTVELGRRERSKLSRSFDGALQQRMQDAGHNPPASLEAPSAIDAWRASGRARSDGVEEPAWLRAAERSSVMRDAREVAARRKRQLGKGKP
jgi:hypothetical protein